MPSHRLLLVLDLNGFLIDRGFSVGKDDPPFHARVRRHYVWKRPHLSDFLDFLLERFDVGVWSSGADDNVRAQVAYLFGDRAPLLKFVWSQSQCAREGDRMERPGKPLYMKDLALLWSRFPDVRPDSTLLVDDCAEKCLRNPPRTVFNPLPWKRTDVEDDALGANGHLRAYFGGLATT